MGFFAEKLRELRLAQGLSQAELAKQLGMTKSRINMYERGEREPRGEALAQIAAYFDTDLNTLLGIPPTMHFDRMDPARRSAIPTEGEEEAFLLSAYRALSPAGRAYLRQSLYLAQRLK